MTGRKFLFNVVVWGESYTRQLIDYTLPSLLAPDNIPALVKLRDCEFLFVTTSQDADLLEKSSSFIELSKYLPVVFSCHEFGAFPGTKYDRMTAGHKIVCKYGQEHGAYGVFLMPEMLVSNGSLLYLDQSVKRGMRAIVMPVLRLVEEEVAALRGPTRISLSSREMAKLLFEHAHHEMQSFMIDSGFFSASPGFVIWRIPEQNAWLIHGLHSQPILVDLRDADPEALAPSIDAGNFVASAVVDHNTVDVVADSDLMLMCSLTSVNDIPTPHNWVPPTWESLWVFIKGTPYINELHRHYFRQPVIFHSEGIPQGIEEHLKASASFVAAALLD